MTPATPDTPTSATAGHREPLISAIHPLDPPTPRSAAPPRRPRTTPHRHRLLDRRPHPPHPPQPQPQRRTGNDKPRGDRQVGADVLAAFGAEHKLWTEHLLTRLATLDDRYIRWTAEDLADALRPFGITPIQVWHAGRNRNGYDRDTLARALNTE